MSIFKKAVVEQSAAKVGVFGRQGCLSGDTPIHYTIQSTDGHVQNRKGGTIARLYERFHRLHSPGRGNYMRPQTVDSEFVLPSVNADDRVFLNGVRDVVNSGRRPCIQITTRSGHEIVATEEHRFYTGEQYAPLHALRVGERLMVHVNARTTDTERTPRTSDRKYICVKHHGVGGIKVVAGRYRYHRVSVARAVVEAQMNEMSYVDYVQRLNEGPIDGLVFLPRHRHVHHIDEDYTNNDFVNLAVIDGGEHNRLHALREHNNLRFAAVPDEIATMRCVGPRPTYDIVMAAPFNNFVGDRFVVHNSGKTTTAAMMSIGLSKTFHKNAPVFFFDTESGSDFVVELFEAEGVELIHGKSRSFKDMRAGLAEADASGACAYLVDSYTHPWTELVSTFKAKSKRKKLEMHHQDELKTIWRGWTDQMLASPAHCLLAGRLGFEWGEEDDDETGGRKLIKLGSKLKGEADAGYEPHLLIEMEQLQDADTRMKKTRAKKGSSQHHAYVLKDRWRSLSGRMFTFKTMNDYKPGDYKKVFDPFLPHWSRLTIGGAHRSIDASRNSADLFDAGNGQSVYAERQRRKEVATEEVQAMLVKVWPGQDAASKQAKQAAIKQLFDVYAWRSVEEKSLEDIERALAAMQKFVALAETNPPANHDAAIDLLAECRDAVNDETAPTQIGEIASEERQAF